MNTSAEFFEQWGGMSMHLRAPMQGDQLPITGRYAPTGYKLAVLVYRNDDRQALLRLGQRYRPSIPVPTGI